jgi:lipopolysaccharide transport system permease protein
LRERFAACNRHAFAPFDKNFDVRNERHAIPVSLSGVAGILRAMTGAPSETIDRSLETPKPETDTDSRPWTTVIRSGRGLLEIPWAQLWRYRDLIVMFAQRDITTSYKQTVLGPLWFIVQPVMVTVVFSYLFGRMARFGTDDIPHYLFYMSGLVPWGFFAESVTKTSNVFVVNANLFGKIYFPRMVMPISGVLTNCLPMLIQMGLFLIGFFYYLAHGNPFVDPSWKIVLVPLVFVQLAALALGIGCIVSALTRRFRDLAFGIKLGMQLWMFGSAIVFPLSRIAPEERWIFMLNPVVPPIEFFRQAFLGVSLVPNSYFLLSAGVSFVVLVIGVILFNRAEQTAMDTI